VCVRTTLSPRWGLLINHLPTYGLRRGPHSYAALRLRSGQAFAAEICSFTHRVVEILVLRRTLKAPPKRSLDTLVGLAWASPHPPERY
jgi:hypothetical protein